MYKDRAEAGHKLAVLLKKYKEQDCIVLALPRGGVMVGHAVACELQCSLDFLLVEKLRYPTNPEYAIGAVTIEEVMVSESLGVPKEFINQETERIRNELRNRRLKYAGDRTFPDIKRKTVILVDDGIVTGLTILSAINAVKKYSPEKIVVAVPVAPREAAEKIEEVADDVIIPILPPYFTAVEDYYSNFNPITDEEVIRTLNINCDDTSMPNEEKWLD